MSIISGKVHLSDLCIAEISTVASREDEKFTCIQACHFLFRLLRLTTNEDGAMSKDLVSQVRPVWTDSRGHGIALINVN